jgi:undecaprenyl-diphosphatase
LTARAREADLRLLILLRTRLRRPGLERAMRSYTSLGEYGRIWIVGALAGALLDRARSGRWLWAALCVPLTLALNYCLKTVVRRERPRLEGIAAASAMPASRSFPSAHAATSFAGATLIGALVPALRPPLYLAAAVMAFTRPYLGLHYPSDVVVGAGVGCIAGRLLERGR